MSLVFNLKKVFTLDEVIEILVEQLSMHIPLTEAHLLEYAKDGFLTLSLEFEFPFMVKESCTWYSEDLRVYEGNQMIKFNPGIYNLSLFDDAAMSLQHLKFNSLLTAFGVEKDGKLYQLLESMEWIFGEDRYYAAASSLSKGEEAQIKVTKANLKRFIDLVKSDGEDVIAIEKPKRGRPNLDQAKRDEIKAAHLKHPDKSARLLGEELNIPESTVKKHWQ